ncbi:MAG: hypothetical protein D6690_10850 [Nitrospirae bacterium]|nr:MAG: hypothetical protein D6690_10850 [Nitrospirota bacterium]
MPKLLIFIFRRSLEETVAHLLHDLNVHNYTLIHSGVVGRGTSGIVEGTFEKPGENAVLLLELPDKDVPMVVEKFKEFHEIHEAKYHVPLRLFVLPCERII